MSLARTLRDIANIAKERRLNKTDRLSLHLIANKVAKIERLKSKLPEFHQNIIDARKAVETARTQNAEIRKRQGEMNMGKMDPAIIKFAQNMQYKLDLNKDKECDKMNPDGKGRSWKDCDLAWLLYRLREETLELEKALYETNRQGVLDESADVGNFAMMIHDIVLMTKPESRPNPTK